MEDVSKCDHPVVMKDLCAICGLDLRINNEKRDDGIIDGNCFRKGIPVVHHIPELQVNKKHALELGKADEKKLLKERKLVLLVDLDQTLIHTTCLPIPENLKDVFHFQLTSPTFHRFPSRKNWYHVKVRPGTKEFLEKISLKYELHIFTFGARAYAHMIADILDPDKTLFANRILSRDEFRDPQLKTANLKFIFPCGDHMLCIIDDREEVWQFAKNLIQVKEYTFFPETGDINAPLGTSSVQRNVNCDVHVPDDASVVARVGDECNYSSPGVDYQDGLASSLHENVTPHQFLADQKVDCPKNNSSEISRSCALNQPQDSGYVVQKTSSQEFDSDQKLSRSTDLNQEIQLQEGGGNAEYECGLLSDTVEGISQSKGSNNVVESLNVECESQRSVDDKGQEEDEVSNNKVGSTNENIQTEESNRHAGSRNFQDKCETETPEEPSKSVVSQGHETIDKSNAEEEQILADKGVLSCSNSEDAGSTKSQISPTDDCSNEVRILEDFPQKCTDNQKQMPLDSARVSGALIEWPDRDDYLLYLEDILNRIHQRFYAVYDSMVMRCSISGASMKLPNVKAIMTELRRHILQGCNVVFSGVVSVTESLENSRVYVMARSMGARVHSELKRDTTHVIAARSGTAKVHEARRFPHVHVVGLSWLHCCWERWERVSERLFPLLPAPNVYRPFTCQEQPRRKIKKTRPAPSDTSLDSSTLLKDDDDDSETGNATEPTEKSEERTRNLSADRLGLSPEDLEDLTREVDEALNDESSAEAGGVQPVTEDSSHDSESLGTSHKEAAKLKRHVLRRRVNEDSDSSSGDSISADLPRGLGLKRRFPRRGQYSSEEEEQEKPVDERYEMAIEMLVSDSEENEAPNLGTPFVDLDE